MPGHVSSNNPDAGNVAKFKLSQTHLVKLALSQIPLLTELRRLLLPLSTLNRPRSALRVPLLALDHRLRGAHLQLILETLDSASPAFLLGSERLILLACGRVIVPLLIELNDSCVRRGTRDRPLVVEAVQQPVLCDQVRLQTRNLRGRLGVLVLQRLVHCLQEVDALLVAREG